MKYHNRAVRRIHLRASLMIGVTGSMIGALAGYASPVLADDLPPPMEVSQFLPPQDLIDSLHVDRAHGKVDASADFGQFGSPTHPFPIHFEKTSPLKDDILVNLTEDLTIPRMATNPTSMSTMYSLISPIDNLLFYGKYPLSTGTSYFTNSSGGTSLIGFGDSAGVYNLSSGFVQSQDGVKYSLGNYILNTPPISSTSYSTSVSSILFPNGEEWNFTYIPDGKASSTTTYKIKRVESNWGYGIEFRYTTTGGEIYYYNKSDTYCPTASTTDCTAIPATNRVMSYSNTQTGTRTVAHEGNNLTTASAVYDVSLSGIDGEAIHYTGTAEGLITYDNWSTIDDLFKGSDTAGIKYTYDASQDQEDIVGPYVSTASYGNINNSYSKSGGDEDNSVIVNGIYSYWSDVMQDAYLQWYVQNGAEITPPHAIHGRLYRTTGTYQPEGGTYTFTRDQRGNLTAVTQQSKDGSTRMTVESAVYPDDTSASADGCANRLTCNKPTSVTDGNGNTTVYTWSSDHGGLLSALGPAPASGDAHPLKLVTWEQRYAWILNASGTLVQESQPIWVEASEIVCQTAAGSDIAACDTSAPETTTTYQYGSEGTREALLLKGVAVTADGTTLRTCYGYDKFGHRTNTTSPNANLTTCS